MLPDKKNLPQFVKKKHFWVIMPFLTYINVIEHYNKYKIWGLIKYRVSEFKAAFES